MTLASGLRDEQADLVERPMGEEDGERGQPRDVAHGGEAGRHADHVLLGDPHLEEAVRYAAGEGVRLGGGGQVRVQDEDVRVRVGEVGQRLAPVSR